MSKAIGGKDTAEMLQQHHASQDAQMGQQLTEQYHRATGGMKEVVIFGAMMMKLREQHPEMTQAHRPKKLSTRGQLSENDGPVTLSKWLETYAPQVKRTTALRFLHVTEAIAEDYESIVGAKVAKLMPMAQLVTTALEELPANVQAKQLELFEWVNGTSQRSWLDRFSPESPQKRGHRTKVEQGNNTPRAKTAEDLAEDAREEITQILNLLDGWLLAAHHTRLEKDLRLTTEACLEEAIKKIRAVR